MLVKLPALPVSVLHLLGNPPTKGFGALFIDIFMSTCLPPDTGEMVMCMCMKADLHFKLLGGRFRV